MNYEKNKYVVLSFISLLNLLCSPIIVGAATIINNEGMVQKSNDVNEYVNMNTVEIKPMESVGNISESESSSVESIGSASEFESSSVESIGSTSEFESNPVETIGSTSEVDIEPVNSEVEDSNQFGESDSSTIVESSEGLAMEGNQKKIIASGTYGTARWELESEGRLVVSGGETAYSGTPWRNYKDQISEIYFTDSLKLIGIASNRFFADYPILEKINTEKLDVSKVETMTDMFANTPSLTTIDVSNWDTSKVNDMSHMFNKASSLTSIDTSNWDTSNVDNMNYMFSNASSLTSIDVSNWNTSNVTTMMDMFTNASSLTSLDVSKWDTSKVYSMLSMFMGGASLTSLDVSNWDTSNLIGIGNMFAGTSNLTSLDVSKWDTSKVLVMGGIFENASSLTSLDISKWDTSNVKSMHRTFKNTSSLTSLDISNWDTSNVKDITEMFAGTSNLTSIDVSKWNTSRISIMNGVFAHASKLEYLDLSNWKIMDNTEIRNIFMDTIKLSSIKLGANSVFTYNTAFQSPKLPEWSTLSSEDQAKYTTRWIGTTTNRSYETSGDLTSQYDGSMPDIYTRELKKNNKYTVTFNSNGGSTIPSQAIEKNQQLIKPEDPVKLNYLFKGWYSDVELTEEFNFATPVTSDFTLYAKWEESETPTSKYTVTFNSNGGTKIPSQTIEKDQLLVTPVSPEKENNQFKGWYSDVELTEEFNFATPVTSDFTLYAKWEESETSTSKYTVTFNSNGGTKIPSQTIEKDQLLVTPVSPEKENNQFKGWYSDIELTEEFNFATPVTSDFTLYAKWEESETPTSKYTVTFNSNGGTKIPSQTIEKDQLLVTPAIPEKENNQFKGWYSDIELTEEFNFATPVTSDLTLYAKWEKLSSGSLPHTNSSTPNKGGNNKTTERKVLPKTGEINNDMTLTLLILLFGFLSLNSKKKKLETELNR